jgi:hypothetical protein
MLVFLVIVTYWPPLSLWLPRATRHDRRAAQKEARTMNEPRREGSVKVLVPVDGSANSDRVIDQLLAELAGGAALELVLLNVQIPVDSGHARMFVAVEDVEAYHREEGLQALKSARNKLDAAG